MWFSWDFSFRLSRLTPKVPLVLKRYNYVLYSKYVLTNQGIGSRIWLYVLVNGKLMVFLHFWFCLSIIVFIKCSNNPHKLKRKFWWNVL